MIKKSLTVFIISFLILALTNAAFTDPGDPTIISVSTTLGSTGSATGSFLGGTLVYIKGTNFSPSADENAVTIGPYPCILEAQGAKVDSLTCRTTAATNPAQLYSLPVTVTVGTVFVKCNTNNCVFSYSQAKTPFIHEIIPRSVVGDGKVYVFGTHRISDLGDARSPSATQINYLTIGDNLCSTTDVIQDDDSYYSYSRSAIQCLADVNQVAGQYKFVQQLDFGLAKHSIRTLQTSLFTGKNYTQRVVPKINSISTHQGGSQGQRLVLKGSGFSSNLADFSCKFAGQVCTVTQAGKTELSIEIPTIPGTNTELGALSKDPSDTTTQSDNFLGSQGALYKRYSIGNTRNSFTTWLTQLRGTINFEKVSQKIITQLSSPESYGQYYLQYVKGYFHAPVDGEYRFNGLADDTMYMALSSVQNNSNVDNLQVILTTQSHNTNHYISYVRANNTKSVSNVTLTTGYYYFQFININYGGSGFFKVTVDLPEVTTYNTNPTWQIDSVVIKPSQYDAEIIQVEVFGASGTFDLYYYDSNNKLSLSQITIGVSAYDFFLSLSKLSNIYDYGPTVTRVLLDVNGAQTTNSSLKEGYRYTITLNRYRPLTSLPYSRTTNVVSSANKEKSISVTRTSEHSAPLTGTFILSVGGSPLTVDGNTNLSPNVDVSRIANALNILYGTSEITASRILGTYSSDTIEFVIQYVGLIETPQPITINTITLLGGKTGATINSDLTILRSFSRRPLYSPVPLQFLYTASATPAITISVNSIPAVCSDCSYQINAAATPVVSTSTLSNSNQSLTLAVSDPGSLGFGVSDISITFLGASCLNPSGTLSSLVCTFDKNSDLTPALPAGTGKPIVHVANIGYADNSALTDGNIALTVTDITPTQTSPGGGAVATIRGTGFPLSQSTDLSIQICGNSVTQITSVSNTQIRFVVPAQVTSCNSNSQITFNGISSPITFTYNPSITPQVTSLSKSSSSPVLKSDLVITGLNFGTRDTTEVYLVQNGKRIYFLNILTITSTEISVVLGGGISGEYDIVVLQKSNGQSIPDANSKFYYKIIINSLSISSGQKGGGYNLTINGVNFANSKGSNIVFIGEAQNSICEVLQYSTTTITCRVPRKFDQYQINTPLAVVVTGRIVEESVCQGTCDFTYLDTGASIIDIPASTTFTNGQSITITGTDLQNAIVTVGEKTATVSANTATQLTFVYPDLPAGQYQVFINVANGWTYPQLLSKTVLSIQSSSGTSGSLRGKRVTISGNGFPIASKITPSLQCTDATALTVISATPKSIVVNVPQYIQGSTACKINVTIGTSFKVFDFNYRPNNTAELTVSGSGLSFSFTKVNMTSTFIPTLAQFVWLDSGNPTTSIYTATISGTSFSFTYLPAGTFKVLLHSQTYGYAAVTSGQITSTFASVPTIAAVESSYAGGKQITITGSGFNTINPKNNDINVCGIRANVISATETSAVFETPAFVTEITQNQYTLSSVKTVSGTPFGDSVASAKNIKDNSFNTVYSSTNQQCFVGLDFGLQNQVDISRIRYVPNPKWANSAIKLDGGIFQGSNDGTNYVTIFTIDTSLVHSGYNVFTAPQSGPAIKYRYIRFKHTSLSACNLAQLEVVGILYSQIIVPANSNYDCDVKLNGNSVTVANKVTYSHSLTSTVSGISPSFAPSTGGDVIHITGNGFVSPVVTIDGINCPLVNSTASEIYCTTGLRSTPPSTGNSFSVISNGNPAIIAVSPFLYIDRWSSENTWGNEAIPRKNDSVYVPVGMTLLVDQSTPVLYSVIVEGKIKFEDTKDLTFDAHYFVINGGEFQAGTESNPFQNKLTFTLHGGYYDKQLPTFGNKVIGCRNCKFNMHGKVRKTWTQVQTTINAGATSFTVIEPVDWVAGEKIAVASTSFDHYQTEEKIISSVSGNGLTITVTTPFKYRHFAAVETYGATDIVMRAQVGLLTRNIVIRGDESSKAAQYGSHLMMTGRQSNGLIAKISYIEGTHCGQPKIVGRYCTHFHMAGQVPDSYVRGIAVHDSFARVLTIHGTHFLLVEKNVGFHVKGHNIFVQDGIETNNVIQDNLMMSSIASNIMLQSDITVASYWITNPYNTVRRNHAAGGDFYGFWYEIKSHPDGPSATSDICPMGMQLGISEDNVAHSNRRFGLRIFKLSARKFPCLPTYDESLEDPYTSNPSIHSQFDNFTLWKNEECGFLGEQLGYMTINNFKTIDSRKGGLQFHKTNFTKELVIAQNSVVVGFSQGNAPTNINADYENARGVMASRTDGLKVTGIQFYNFGSTMTPLQSCSQCYHFKLWVVGSKTTEFENITYTNITGNYIFWQKWRRQVFVDIDGTLTTPFRTALTTPVTAQNRVSITPFRPSLKIPNHCYNEVIGNDLWDNSLWCDSTVTLRSILFTNADPAIDFKSIDIKSYLLSDPNQNVSALTQDKFSQQYMIVIKKMSLDIVGSWAMPYAVGHYYNIHWKWGIDFTHLSIAPSRLWESNQGVVLRFNYTDNRELFKIGKWYKQQLQTPILTASLNLIDPTTCQNGDYFHDEDNRYLFVCVSGRNKKVREWIDINGIRCLNFCPTEQQDAQREEFSRLWSNVTQWPNGRLPTAGENVTIPYAWNLILDITTPVFKYVLINGILIFDRQRDNTFEAHYIWVKQGIIRIGTQDSPFTNQANIILHGNKDDRYLTLDPDASGNKMLAVTGGLEFYGIQSQNSWSKLTEIATVGATQIKVISAAGWKVDDKIIIAPSYAGRKEFQEVKITAINGNTITFTPALTFQHYGASGATITNSYGILDTRSAVGLLTRNIRISPAADPNNWGCRVYVYGYNEISEDLSKPPVWRNGYAKLKGVQFDRCGQYDTTYAGLRFQNLGAKSNKNTKTSIVQNVAIHGCVGFCMYIKQVQNLHINNNVFFWARKFLVYVEEIIGSYNFTNNLLIGARKRDQLTNAIGESMMVDDVAAYQQYFPIDYANANISVDVSKNLAQGSQGQGFVLPSVPCQYLDIYPFLNNTAGSAQIGFMFEKIDGQTCLAIKGGIAYASEIGLQVNMPGSHTKVIYDGFFFADNQRGITLRYAHEIDDNTVILQNSYFAGFSRPNCTSCYSDSAIKYCKRGYAVRMFAATIAGETFPLKKKNTVHDIICNQQAFDAKAFVNNVTFENYLYNNPSLPYCEKMAVFKRHNLASDGTGSHHLTNTVCRNCENKSWAYFDKPDLGWRGWFGGCGDLDCTGPNSYVISDRDGSFTGQVSQLLANNSDIGNGQSSCQWIPEMNGHHCLTQDLAVLEYESIAPDFNTRIMWPVYLRYDGGSWNSTTNGWREWEWNGPEPMNLRLGRFWSTIKLHQSYNVTYSSQPPSDTRYQIQKTLLPTGNPNDWIVIRVYYPLPNSIEVLVKNTTGKDILVKPYPLKQGVAEDLTTHKDICGANNFYYENGTIEFVVNGVNNCQVRVRLSSYIKLSTRLEIPIADFYLNNGLTTFIDKICAFLQIDTGRLKIVSIREGSVIIDSLIQTAAPGVDTATTTQPNPSADQTELRRLAALLNTGISSGSLNLGAPVLSYSADTYIFNSDGTIYSPETAETQKTNNKTLIIVLAVLIPAIIAIAVFAGYCYWSRKRAQIHESELVNNKSSGQRENKGSTEFEISAVDDYSLSANYNNKKWAMP